MINNLKFAARLTEIMDFYGLSASAFSDRIQVPRSSISHLLSGRNRPSLDFVLKVVNEFEEVELYWLLNGKGSFPASKSEESLTESLAKPEVREQPETAAIGQKDHGAPEKEVERIVFFYKDGSFKEYRA